MNEERCLATERERECVCVEDKNQLMPYIGLNLLLLLFLLMVMVMMMVGGNGDLLFLRRFRGGRRPSSGDETVPQDRFHTPAHRLPMTTTLFSADEELSDLCRER